MALKLNIDEVRRQLPGRRISFFESITSTMHEAIALSAAGCPSGTAVVAEEQTAGQGRHGHSWHSAAGDGVYCSLVLPQTPLLTLALGLATHTAIFEATGLVCDLRWPNDLMLADRKVAGILVQAVAPNAIAGIGINVNHSEFPAEVAALATSLRLAAGRAIPREDILLALLPAINAIVPQEKSAILASFTHLSSYASGKRVEVQLPEGAIEGTTVGLNPDGFLIVRRRDGTDTLIVAGGVRAARS